MGTAVSSKKCSLEANRSSNVKLVIDDDIDVRIPTPKIAHKVNSLLKDAPNSGLTRYRRIPRGNLKEC